MTPDELAPALNGQRRIATIDLAAIATELLDADVHELVLRDRPYVL